MDGVLENAAKHEFLSYIPPMVFAETNDGLIKPFSEQDVVEVI